MTSTNHIICLSSDEEDDDKLVAYTDFFDGIVEPSDKKKPKGNIGLRKSNSWDLTVEDDDCVVLDGDPYKMTEKETSFENCETDDEILVIGQKGEIACRDFPHPRHACAKFPFNSTSHDKYCDMCHCYVCDIRAPCPHWCISISSIDHCHANDKEQIWKNQRERIRIGEILPRPALTIAQLQQLPQSQTIRSPQISLYPPATQFGVRACSASTTVATRPNSYIRPGYTTERSKSFPQIPRLQPRADQLIQNGRGGSYNTNPSPQVASSNTFTWTQRPSGSAYLQKNGVHNVSQGSQYTRCAPPAALQGNSQRLGSGYVPTVPASHNKVYPRHFSRNMHSAKAQTNAVPSETPNRPPAKQQQQQQSGSSTDKALSEIEDWLMDNSTPTDPLISGEKRREGKARRDRERTGEISADRERYLRRRRSGERERAIGHR